MIKICGPRPSQKEMMLDKYLQGEDAFKGKPKSKDQNSNDDGASSHRLLQKPHKFY